MNKSKKYRGVFLPAILFVLMISGCNSVQEVSTFIDKEEPQSILMFTYNEDNHSIGNLYYQEENKEKEQIAQNVKYDGYKLMPNSKAILFLDTDNALWYKAPGNESEKISLNVSSFAFCKDESTISFITADKDNPDSPAELYIKKINSEKEKIASDMAHYSDLSYSTFMSDNGDVIFWSNKDGGLYKKEGMNDKEKISANANIFSVKK